MKQRYRSHWKRSTPPPPPEAQATKLELELAESVQPLRETEAQRAAALARLKHEQTNLDNDVRRAQQRAEELAARGEQLKGDVARETALVAEAEELRETAGAEFDALTAAAGCTGRGGRRAQVRTRRNRATARGGRSTARRADAGAGGCPRPAQQCRIAHRRAQRRHTPARCPCRANRIQYRCRRSGGARHGKARTTAHGVQGAQARIDGIETALAEAERQSEASRDALCQAQSARETANVELRRIEAERETLQRLLQSDRAELPPVIDQLVVEPGYEAALAAALGDDLDVPIGGEDVVHWRAAEEDGDADAEVPTRDAGLPARLCAVSPRSSRHHRNCSAVSLRSGWSRTNWATKCRARWRPVNVWFPAKAPMAMGRADGAGRRCDVGGTAARRAQPFDRARRRGGRCAGRCSRVVRKASRPANRPAAETQRRCEELRRSRRDEQEARDRLGRELAEVESVARDCIARLATLQEARETCAGELAALNARHQQAEAELAELRRSIISISLSPKPVRRRRRCAMNGR